MRKLIQFAVDNPGWTLIIGIAVYYVVSYGTLKYFGLAPY